MLSDGKVISAKLEKRVCDVCGLALSHAPDRGKNLYGRDYTLGNIHDSAAQARARNQAAFIGGVLQDTMKQEKTIRVLEVGCSNGLTLAQLHVLNPAAQCVGIDPAPGDSKVAGVQVLTGTCPDLWGKYSQVLEAGGFDFIYSINVVEHVEDPVAFLREHDRLLTDNGCLVLTCPDGNTPNIELLFADHLSSFTTLSMHLIARQCGLVVTHQYADSPRTGFQTFVLSRKGLEHATPLVHAEINFPDLNARRQAYYERWSGLQRDLQARLDEGGRRGKLYVFGAGEAAQLLQAYAPDVWEQVDALLVDDPVGCRSFDKAILKREDQVFAQGDVVIVAAHPSSEAIMAAKIRGTAATVVLWGHLAVEQPAPDMGRRLS